ncbi:MAG: hypothetical protein HY088_08840 [Ignavibacteriales bacterium]|nr:hypothetical protein [Ignavibacteriales bacterium]
MENKLRSLYALQQIDSNFDELQDLKGDLPRIVADLQERVRAQEAKLHELEALAKNSLIRRDAVDLEIISSKEKVEKYKEQQFQIKTNKQYDALTREIDLTQARINALQKEMDVVEGRASVAKEDSEALKPAVEELQKELQERQAELNLVNKEHEDEELKLKHEREKLVVRIDKNDLRAYERIRKAMGGKAVVAVRRNACGGCFKRVTPQAAVELRKNSKLMTCEHCGRMLVSDEIVESYSTKL